MNQFQILRIIQNTIRKKITRTTIVPVDNPVEGEDVGTVTVGEGVTFRVGTGGAVGAVPGTEEVGPGVVGAGVVGLGVAGPGVGVTGLAVLARHNALRLCA